MQTAAFGRLDTSFNLIALLYREFDLLLVIKASFLVNAASDILMTPVSGALMVVKQYWKVRILYTANVVVQCNSSLNSISSCDICV